MKTKFLPDEWLLPLLISRGKLTASQAEEVRASGTTCVFADLERRGLSTMAIMAHAVLEKYGIKFADPASPDLDKLALSLVPEEVCSKHLLVPLKVEGNSIQVLMANPLDDGALQAVNQVSGRTPVPVFGITNSIRALVAAAFGSEAVVFDLLRKLPQSESVEVVDSGAVGPSAKAEVSAPVVQLVDAIIAQAVRLRASDIHVEHDDKSTTVRYRVDGDLRTVLTLPRKVGEGPLVSRIKIMADLDIADRRRPQDGRATLLIGGQEVGLRVSTLPTAFGEKAVLRILDKKASIISMAALGFGPEIMERIQGMVDSEQGILLVTGPTGSGKTTTLYSLLNALKSDATNIVTVEDPIEYRMEGINQVQVHEKAGLTFASILRSVLRQDPDVVLIGEIRDRETAEIAFQAALTGHLVMSTLHTNSALLTISRLLDMGLETYKMVPAFVGIVSQRLARRLCRACRVNTADGTFSAPGCDACGGTGVSGRIAVAEVLDLREPAARELLQKTDLAAFGKEALVRKWLLPISGAVRWHIAEGNISAAEGAPWLEAPSAPSDAAVPSPPAGPRIAAVDPTAPAPEARRSVLVIDDNPDNRSIAVATLNSEGYRVAAANDGLLGLKAVEQERPDLILLDIMMPGLDGYGFLKRLRGEMGLASLPVLVVSAMGEAESQALALELGADDFLTKPFNPTVLKARVKALFRRVGKPVPALYPVPA